MKKSEKEAIMEAKSLVGKRTVEVAEPKGERERKQYGSIGWKKCRVGRN